VSPDFSDDRRPLRPSPLSFSLFPETFPEASASLLVEQTVSSRRQKSQADFPKYAMSEWMEMRVSHG
jgi:hypothetical protein